VESRVDLHVHSNASDGECSPTDVVSRAAEARVTVIALTDHDTLDGVDEAVAAGQRLGIRVVTGCEFSVRVRWGEMHLLGYFLPHDDAGLGRFLAQQRTMREKRALEIVARLRRAGVTIDESDVFMEAGGAVGRPHVARVLVRVGVVADINEAFDKYLAAKRPGFVPKQLPGVAEVTELVRRVNGVTSAAHLRGRAGRAVLRELRSAGVDGVEVLHPAHDDATATRLDSLAAALAMLPTGGSDWHGDDTFGPDRAPIGSMSVPPAWLESIERLHLERTAAQASV
jgi:predicted metal-dependent phosphoesterase TrpH